MKKTILLLIAALICATSYGQRKLKYKDIYDRLGKEPTEHTLLKLNEFQTLTPEFPNTYMQSGLIYWAWLQKEDPFLNYQYVRQLIYNTKLYLGLAISKINADEKEVKKNSTYYTNLGVGDAKTVSQAAVLKVLNEIIDKVKEYDEHVTVIIENFNLAIDKYNTCTETFKQIVGRQSNYKNLLVTNLPELREELKKLSRDYDSVMICFSVFKNELANYPIKQYNQQLDIKPINTYRLEGLTSTNFIQPKIPVWDYQGWVKEANSLLDGNISEIKNGSASEIKALRDRVAALQKRKAETDSILTITPSNKLVNLTEKYDYESLLSASLRYEAAKANLQIASLRSTNNIQNPDAFKSDYNQKAAYYYDLYLMERTCRDLLIDQTSRINDKSLTLHDQSITAIYGDKNKFAASHRADQDKLLSDIQSQNLEHFKAFTVEQFAPADISFQLNEQTITAAPASISADDAAVNEYTTVYTCKNGAGVRYVTGYRKTGDKTATGFVAKHEVGDELTWCKDINVLPTGFNKVIQVIPIRTGGFLALVANSNEGVVKSTVFKMDNDGKQISKTDLTSALYPATFTYDDISETVAVALKGTDGNSGTESLDDAELEIAVIGQKQSSVGPKFSLKGKIADVIKASSGYLVICNYTELNAGGKTFTSKSDVAAIAINGSEIKASACNSKDEVRAIKAFKINAETVNITGAYDALGSATSMSEKPAYMLLTTAGQFIYKN